MQAAALGGPVTYLDPEEAKKIEEREGYALNGRARHGNAKQAKP
jgi:hypothetical protein